MKASRRVRRGTSLCGLWLALLLPAPLLAQPAPEQPAAPELAPPATPEQAPPAAPEQAPPATPEQGPPVEPGPAPASPSAPAGQDPPPAPLAPDDGAGVAPSVPPAPAPSTEPPAATPKPTAAEQELSPTESEPDDGRMQFDPTTGRYVPRGEQLPWRNSFFAWTHGLTTNTLARDSQLSYNPTYFQLFSLRPRWNFTDTLSLRVRQDLAIEFTDSDTTASRQEPQLLDTTVSLLDVNVVEVAGIAIGGGPQLVLPLSPASQAADRYFGAAAIALATRSFGGVLEGLAVQLSGSYTRFFAGSNVVQSDSPFNCELATPLAGGVVCSQVAGPSTVRDSLVATAAAQIMVLPGLSFSTDFTGWWQLAHGLADAHVETLTGTTVLADQSDTHWRNATWWTLTGSYQFFDWLEGSLGLSTLTANRDPDGSRRNPFFNDDTELRLGALVTLDRLYLALRRRGAQSY